MASFKPHLRLVRLHVQPELEDSTRNSRPAVHELFYILVDILSTIASIDFFSSSQRRMTGCSSLLASVGSST
ncbi:hypothetical protein C4D60_Mb04t35670 [Musa balbisiana]|uniref:Uncharacterized protein n=1 Tax=Musa balbisiana TaxID=52838 RepID=A0A4S8KH10_MUSBA|nr:hypothetical protein C4D60_Mb04t35670 [Musa balbisiana]